MVSTILSSTRTDSILLSTSCGPLIKSHRRSVAMAWFVTCVTSSRYFAFIIETSSAKPIAFVSAGMGNLSTASYMILQSRRRSTEPCGTLFWCCRCWAHLRYHILVKVASVGLVIPVGWVERILHFQSQYFLESILQRLLSMVVLAVSLMADMAVSSTTINARSSESFSVCPLVCLFIPASLENTEWIQTRFSLFKNVFLNRKTEICCITTGWLEPEKQIDHQRSTTGAFKIIHYRFCTLSSIAL